MWAWHTNTTWKKMPSTYRCGSKQTKKIEGENQRALNLNHGDCMTTWVTYPWIYLFSASSYSHSSGYLSLIYLSPVYPPPVSPTIFVQKRWSKLHKEFLNNASYTSCHQPPLYSSQATYPSFLPQKWTFSTERISLQMCKGQVMYLPTISKHCFLTLYLIPPMHCLSPPPCLESQNKPVQNTLQFCHKI